MSIQVEVQKVDINSHKLLVPSPNLLRFRRKQAGLTTGAAADRINEPGSPCDNRRIAHWETGKHVPNPKSLAKIANAYECEIADFYPISVDYLKEQGNAAIEEHLIHSTDSYKKARIAVDLHKIPESTIHGDNQNPLTFLDVRDPDKYAFESLNCMKIKTTLSPFVIVSGPTRCGKTEAILERILYECFAHPNLEVIIVRVHTTDLPPIRKSITSLIKYKLDDPMCPIKVRGGIYDFNTLLFPNGSRIRLGGMDRPGKILGDEADIIFFNQAEQSDLEQWQTLITRAAGTAGNFIIDGEAKCMLIADANPGRADHYLLDVKEEADVEWIDFDFKDNPLYWRKEAPTEKWSVVDHLDKTLHGIFHDRWFKGLWKSPDGAVFVVPDAAIIEGLPSPEQIASWNIYRACDWGMDHPTICLWIGRDAKNNTHVYREYRRVHTDISMVGQHIDGYNGNEVIKQTIIDYDENRQKLLLRDHNIRSVMARKGGGSVMDSIFMIQAALRKSEEGADGGLYLYTDMICNKDPDPRAQDYPENLIFEMQGLEYDENKDAPKKENDDAVDALRYYFLHVSSRQDWSIPTTSDAVIDITHKGVMQ